MTAIPLVFAGETFLLDPAGCVFWPRLAMLAVADLHLEKGSACARGGQLVPPWDTRVTLARLAALVARYRPLLLVAVGDSFQDDQAASRLEADDLATLDGIARDTRLVWVTGNHDPSPPQGVAGDSVAEFLAGPIVFRHQARPGATGEISGHYHPKARVATRAGEIVRPCFVADSDRLILPSFGAYTGGLDVRNPAIAALFPNGAEAFLLGRTQLFRFAVPPALPRTLAALPATHRFI
jgi:DNA ligase-associated metallophosphoesterase